MASNDDAFIIILINKYVHVPVPIYENDVEFITYFHTVPKVC